MVLPSYPFFFSRKSNSLDKCYRPVNRFCSYKIKLKIPYVTSYYIMISTKYRDAIKPITTNKSKSLVLNKEIRLAI